MNNGGDEKFSFDPMLRSLGGSSVQLQDDIYRKYSEWDCGKRDTSGEALPCVGLCLGTAVLTQDFVTPTSDRLDTQPPTRVSNIHDVRLLNPMSGEDLTPRIQQERGTLSTRMMSDPIAL